MNPLDARTRETREWLQKTAEDLASARVLIRAGHSANALLSCQQFSNSGGQPESLSEIDATFETRQHLNV